ncbi:hypothetical protein BKA70DRAFT_1218790 [Coprinopsis sp. MPI-PUGE-AT-0042]|nr:hypothetical protein BKA70DRAFT_1218790 [Coprinopsis sp. MPI-PUGE-AT-0042]
MESIRLPAEIVLEIVETLGFEWDSIQADLPVPRSIAHPHPVAATLKQLSVTSQYLRYPTQRHLFRRFILHVFRRPRPEVRGPIGYSPKAMEDLMSIFQDHPQLLRYIKKFTLPIKPSAQLEPHFVSSVLPFFARELRSLHHFHIEGEDDWGDPGSLWSALDSGIRSSIRECLLSNIALRIVEVSAMYLPLSFSNMLPSSVEEIVLNCCQIEEEANELGMRDARQVAAPSSIGTANDWFRNQNDHFLRQVSSVTGDLTILHHGPFLERVSRTLTQLHLSYQVGSTEGLKAFRGILHRPATGLESTIPLLPHLKEVTIRVDLRDGYEWACPPSVVDMLVVQLIPQFANMEALNLDIAWIVDLELSSDEPLLGPPEHFSRLDEVLSRRKMYPCLRKVAVALEPRFRYRNWDPKDGQRWVKRINQEAQDLFVQTRDVVDTVSVSVQEKPAGEWFGLFD